MNIVAEIDKLNCFFLRTVTLAFFFFCSAWFRPAQLQQACHMSQGPRDSSSFCMNMFLGNVCADEVFPYPEGKFSVGAFVSAFYRLIISTDLDDDVIISFTCCAYA